MGTTIDVVVPILLIVQEIHKSNQGLTTSATQLHDVDFNFLVVSDGGECQLSETSFRMKKYSS